MRLKEYQEATRETAVYPKEMAVYYCALGLIGEAGEIANKVKKVIRDSNSHISIERKKHIADEIGDVMWYVARLSDELGLSLEAIVNANITKLLDRKERGVLKGSGDSR